MRNTNAPKSDQYSSALTCLKKRADFLGQDQDWRWVLQDPVVSSFSTLLLELNKEEKIHLSEHLEKSLRNQYWHNVARFVKIEHQFKELLNHLEDSDIQVIPLKGAAILFLDHQKMGHRPMDDFDILVHPSQFIQAAKILLTAGLTPEGCKDPAELFEFTTLDPQYWPRELHFYNNQELNIDLHQNLITNHWYITAFPIEIDSVWKRSIEVSQPYFKNENSSCHWKLMLSPYDMLAHLCLHQAWHGLQIMKNFYDIDLFIQNLPQDWHWEQFLEIANQWQIRSCAYHAFTFCQFFFNTPIPADVFQDLDPGILKRWQLRFFISPDAILKNKPTIGKRYATIVKFVLFDSLNIQFQTIKTLLSPDKTWMQDNPKKYNLFSHIQHIISVIKRGV